MKRTVLLLCLTGLSFLLKAQQDVVVDPDASLRTVNGSFSAIKVKHGIDLYLSQSDQQALAVSATDDQSKAAIRTEIDGDVLNIYIDGEKGWLRKGQKMRVYVSFSNLTKIKAESAADVYVIGNLTATSLAIHLSEASGFNGLVHAGSLTMNLSGAADAKISGTANTMQVESSGASDVKGYDLVTNDCQVSLSGASDVHITVNRSLSVTASGASDVRFKGSGTILEKHLTGSSSVRRVNAE